MTFLWYKQLVCSAKFPQTFAKIHPLILPSFFTVNVPLSI